MNISIASASVGCTEFEVEEALKYIDYFIEDYEDD